MIEASRPGTGPPLRVLQVVTTPRGGDWFFDQVTGLAARGHHVRAVLPDEGPLAARLTAAGIELDIVPLSGWRPRQLPRVAAATARLAALLRDFRPDVVHAHLLKATVACRLTGLAYRRAVQVNQVAGVVHLRSPVLRWFDLGTLRRADMVIGSCRAFAERYRRHGARAVAVSYYGCDVHRFDPAAPAGPFRAELGIPADAPVVGMVAHMYPSRLRAFRTVGVKGHEVFIDAIPRIAARVPGCRVVIVGDEFVGDGGYRRALEARVRDLGVADRTHFVGHRTDVQNVLAAIDVLATPSLEESASYTTIEALLMGKGVVVSNVGGLPDTVQHGETGLLVEPGDAAALADAVADLLLDPPRRAAMGSLGRSRCLRRFDIDVTVRTVESIYRAAIAARGGGTRPAADAEPVVRR